MNIHTTMVLKLIFHDNVKYMYISSVESQNGINDVQRCFVENQKKHPSGSQWNIVEQCYNALLALSR